MSSLRWSRASWAKPSTSGLFSASLFYLLLVQPSRALQILNEDASTHNASHIILPERSAPDVAGIGWASEHGQAADMNLRQGAFESVQWASVALDLTTVDESGNALSQPMMMVPAYFVALCSCLLCCCTGCCLCKFCVPKPEIDKQLVAKVERALIEAENDPEVRWLNDAVAAFWPHLDAYIQKLIITTIQPALKHELPLPLKTLVRFGECTLGNQVPCLGPIVVRERGEDTVVLEIALNLDLGLNLSISHVGVKRVVLSGVLSVIFYPMISEPPFFAGLQFYFANPPSIDLEFSGLAEIAETPYLHQAIRGAISRVVNNLFVSPARFACDLDEEDTHHITDMTFPDPIGILRLTASGLQTPAKDYAAVDVHAVVNVGSESSSLNIKSNDAVDMPIYDLSERVNFEVYAKEGWTKGSQTLIGQAKDLNLDSFSKDGQLKDLPVTLDDANREDGNSEAGMLNVSSRWFTMSKITGIAGTRLADKVGGPAQLLLSVKVLGLSEVPKISINALMSLPPFVVHVSVGPSINRVSGPSWPKYAPVSAPWYTRDMIVKLADKGMSLAEISELVELDTKLVGHILRHAKEPDEEKQAQMQKEYCASVDKVRSVEEPQWNEVIRLLLPWDPDLLICIEVKAQGGFRLGKKLELPLSSIVALPGGELKGPFSMEDDRQSIIPGSQALFSLVRSTGLFSQQDKGLKLHASLRATWFEAS